MRRARSSLLLVCTANICRSPMAQYALLAGLQRRWGPAADAVEVSSAGTHALDGAPIAEHAAALLTGRGIDVEGFRSRRLHTDLVEAADLVLAVTRAHRALVVEIRPGAAAYAFGLREFAWLLEEVPPEAVTGADLPARIASLTALARGQRGARLSDRDLDLADPYGRRKGAYRRTLALIDDAVTVILSRLDG
jgi:protein-tyrosine phosphatase